jgi:hypothetical protein
MYFQVWNTTMEPVYDAVLKKKYCKCPAGSIWVEQPIGKIHRFEVICTHCEKHIKWGAMRELKIRLTRGDALTVRHHGDWDEREVTFDSPEPPSAQQLMGDLNHK